MNPWCTDEYRGHVDTVSTTRDLEEGGLGVLEAVALVDHERLPLDAPERRRILQRRLVRCKQDVELDPLLRNPSAVDLVSRSDATLSGRLILLDVSGQKNFFGGITSAERTRSESQPGGPQPIGRHLRPLQAHRTRACPGLRFRV